MLRAAAQMFSLTVALAITSFIASSLSIPVDPTRFTHCLCFTARPYFVSTGRDHDDWFLMKLPFPVRLIRPHRPVVKPPELVCEMPGDPTAVTPCEQAPINAG